MVKIFFLLSPPPTNRNLYLFPQTLSKSPNFQPNFYAQFAVRSANNLKIGNVVIIFVTGAFNFTSKKQFVKEIMILNVLPMNARIQLRNIF